MSQWEKARSAELLCCLAQAYLGRAKHPGQIFLGWWFGGAGAAGAGGAWAVSFLGNPVLVGLDCVGQWCLGDVSFCLLRMCWGEEGLGWCAVCIEAGPRGLWCVHAGRSVLGQLW